MHGFKDLVAEIYYVNDGELPAGYEDYTEDDVSINVLSLDLTRASYLIQTAR